MNEVTISDAYPLPLPEQIFDQLKGCRLFSKMDLLKGFWQIPLEKETQTSTRLLYTTGPEAAAIHAFRYQKCTRSLPARDAESAEREAV